MRSNKFIGLIVLALSLSIANIATAQVHIEAIGGGPTAQPWGQSWAVELKTGCYTQYFGDSCSSGETFRDGSLFVKNNHPSRYIRYEIVGRVKNDSNGPARCGTNLGCTPCNKSFANDVVVLAPGQTWEDGANLACGFFQSGAGICETCFCPAGPVSVVGCGNDITCGSGAFCTKVVATVKAVAFSTNGTTFTTLSSPITIGVTKYNECNGTCDPDPANCDLCD
ncbi:MAG: hypothetical protein AAF533_06600 [Acidobacteriota bacterium]